MNCKKGDLAITKTAPGADAYADRLVEVVHFRGFVPGVVTTYGPYWDVRPLGWMPPASSCTLNNSGCFLFPDGLLKPIRDPGDDAVDEVLREVGHPLSASHRMREKA